MSMCVVVACMVLSWIFLHRWGQRNKRGPKTWPLVGAAIEQLTNFDRMHDWLVEYLYDSRTVVVPMPFTTYTYIADPINVEHVLKTNFSNYPKVRKNKLFCIFIMQYVINLCFCCCFMLCVK